MGKISGSGTGSSKLRTSGQIKQDKKSKSNLAALPQSNVFSIEGNKGSLSQYKLPDGIVSVDSIIPPQALSILEAQFKSLGLPFDISGLAIKAGQDNRQALKQMEDTVEMMLRNASLLPRWVAVIKEALNIATKSAEAQAEVIKSSLKQQANIDEAHAEMLLAIMGYNKKRNALQLKLERKVKQQEAIQTAQQRYYDKTWGAAKQRIDAQFEFLTDVALEREETKTLQASANKDKQLDRENWKRESI